MKKLLITTFMTLFSTMAFADQIQIINPHSTTGTSSKVLNNIYETNTEMFTAPIKVDNCTVASNIIAETDVPTITIGDYLAQGLSIDQSCNIVSKENLVTIYSVAYYSVCTKKDSGKDLDFLINNPNATVGHYADFIFTRQTEEILKAIGSKGRGVPYKGSKDYLAALQIGEIDYIYTTRANDTLDCILTTNPESDNSVSKYSKNIYTTAYYGLAIYGSNIDLEEVKSIVDQSTESVSWKDKMPSYKNDMTFLTREEQLKIIKDEIDSYQ